MKTVLKEESKYLSANYHEICVKSLLTIYFVLVILLVFKQDTKSASNTKTFIPNLSQTEVCHREKLRGRQLSISAVADYACCTRCLRCCTALHKATSSSSTEAARKQTLPLSPSLCAVLTYMVISTTSQNDLGPVLSAALCCRKANGETRADKCTAVLPARSREKLARPLREGRPLSAKQTVWQF